MSDSQGSRRRPPHWQRSVGWWGITLATLLAQHISSGQTSEVDLPIKQQLMEVDHLTDKLTVLQSNDVIVVTTDFPLESVTEPAILVNETPVIRRNVTNEHRDITTTITNSSVPRLLTATKDYHTDKNNMATTDFLKGTITESNDTPEVEFEQNTHQTASSPLCKPDNCWLRNEINIALSDSNRTQTQRPSYCEIDSNNLDDKWDELRELMQCSVRLIARQELDTRSSVDQVLKWETTLNEFYLKWTKLLHEARISDAEDYKRTIDSLNKQLQDMHGRLQEFKDSLEERNEQLKSLLVALCASELHSGRIQQARHEFQTFTNGADNEVLSRIIEKTYSYVDNETVIRTVANVITFVAGFNSTSVSLTGYTRLYEEMKTNGHLGSPAVLVLVEHVTRSIRSNTESHLKQGFNDLKTNLEQSASVIIEEMATKIRNGENFKDIIEFVKQYSNLFKPYLGKLIERTYLNNLGNIKHVLEFIRNLPFIESCVASYSFLFEAMKQNNHLRGPQLLMMAYHVNETLHQLNDSHQDESTKRVVTELNNTLAAMIIEEWATKVRRDEYKLLTELSENYLNYFKPYINQLIHKAYANNLSNVVPVLKFLRKLPWIQSSVQGYLSLFDKMECNSHLTSHHVLIMAYHVNETKGMTNYTDVDVDIKRQFVELQNKLSSYVNKFIESWSTQVSNGEDYKEIIEFETNYPSYFDLYMDQLILETYSNNLAKLESVLDLISDLKNVSFSIRCYSTLFARMKSNDHLQSYHVLILTYNIKETMDMSGYPDLDAENKETLRELQSTLASAVTKFIESWAIKILNGTNYTEIIDFDKNFSLYFKPNIDEIIEKSYAKNLANVLPVLKFIRDFYWIDSSIVGYSSLFGRMNRNHHLEVHHVLFLAYQANEVMDLPNYLNVSADYKNKSSELKNNLETPVTKFIESWASMISNEHDCTEIINFEEHYWFYFRAFADQIIEKAFQNNLDNVETILSFIQELIYIPSSMTCYSSLFELMKRNGHLLSYHVLLLEYRVKETTSMPGYLDVGEDFNPNFSGLQHKLKESVSTLIEDWATKIRKGGGYTDVLEFEKHYRSFFEPNIDEVIEKAYANDLTNVEHVLNFVRFLTFISSDVSCYSSLFVRMKTNDHFKTHHVLMLASQVKATMEFTVYHSLDAEEKKTMADIQHSLSDHVTQFIESWAVKLRNGSGCTDIKEFDHNYQFYFDPYIDQLLRKAYDNDIANVDPLLTFIHQLSSIKSLIKCYSSLFEMMKSNHHFESHHVMMLAYRVKETMQMTRYQHLAAEEKRVLTDVHNGFPIGIRTLLWDKVVVLESVDQEGFTLSGSDSGAVFTNPPSDVRHHWIVRPGVKDNDLYFTFMNHEHFLFLVGDNEGRVNTVEYQDIIDNQQYWRVCPMDQGSKFYLRNKRNGRLLHAGHVDGNGTSSRRASSENIDYHSAHVQWKIKK